MKSPQERPNGQIPIFSKEELDAVANPQKEKQPLPVEGKSNTLTAEEIENLYQDDDDERKKYWNR